MDTQKNNKAEVKLLILSICLGIVGLFSYAASKFTTGKTMVILTIVGLLGFLVAQAILAVRSKKIKRTLRNLFLSLAIMIAGTYAFLFAFVLFFQDVVANQTSSFFQPKGISTEAAQSFVSPSIDTLTLDAPDGTRLKGWLIKNAPEVKAPLILYFGGSGSEASEMIPYVKNLPGWSIALVNYRGFGQSEGNPSHSTVLDDATLSYDTLIKRADIDVSRVVVMGYSLGTGVAVSLASQRPVRGVILVSPYDHWSLVGVNDSPIFKPIEGVMKPYFNSIAFAPMLKIPMLCLVGEKDTFIPPALSRNLTRLWGGKTTVIEYPGEDHSLLFHTNNSWKDIFTFLIQIQ